MPFRDHRLGAEPATVAMPVRNGLERTPNLAMWLDFYQPDLGLS